MTTLLDSSLTSQLQQALQGSSKPSLGPDAGEVAGLEDQFQSALNAAGAVPAPVSGQIIDGTVVVGGPQAVSAAKPVDPSSAVSATREVASVDPTDSNFLIDGLAKVRGAFTESSSNIMNLSSGSELGQVDRLINMQIEVANYSLLVDVSSKIAGKTVQGLDALMR
ncbi:hypothetical protein [Pseudovibrio sp. Tun.PSC04-5.I4]|uniref:hypothetical protein n=1 Tax=Pseudovibrio sp. Tun.PSC04-5.I4 TaxID=1798213 RepID=UPI00088144CE|nr:hypothetical protein [Pseudovibrio sp. Tun.PSC04-5.I4]SDR14800.1 hypothetical protein SAMN04515695_3017 [Pseudovibrio sp. Tun.PSC04-5.I4]